MRIGIDARMMGKGYGIGRYIEQLVLHLAKTDKNNEYIVFVRPNSKFKILNSKFHFVEADIPWYSWQEQIKLPKIIKKQKLDLMHFPHWNVPLFYKGPFILTIHDLIMYHFPRPEATTLGPFKFFVKDRLHRLVLKRAAKRAKKIIATSQFTKADIEKNLKIKGDKIKVIYQAPFKTDNKPNHDEAYEVLQQYKIDKKYVLYVGSAYPHKNLPGLLKAWEIFTDRHGEDYKLVLVGQDNYFYRKLRQSKLTTGLKNKPIFTGFVSDRQLQALYMKAELYVLPSFYEGFGLQALEAMSYGAPVAVSSASCLPEILGEAALYFNPDDPGEMATAIYRGLTNEDIRLELKLKVPEELKKYSWDKLAKKTIELYETK